MDRRRLTPSELFRRHVVKTLSLGLRKKGMRKSGFYRNNSDMCSDMTFYRILKGENVGCHLLAEMADRLDLQLVLLPKENLKEQTDETQD